VKAPFHACLLLAVLVAASADVAMFRSWHALSNEDNLPLPVRSCWVQVLLRLAVPAGKGKKRWVVEECCLLVTRRVPVAGTGLEVGVGVSF